MTGLGIKNKKSPAADAALSVLVLCAFTFRVLLGALATSGRAKDEQVIRQLNEEVLHAHDIADAATLG